MSVVADVRPLHLLIATLLLAFGAGGAGAQESKRVVGTAVVIDGDTLIVDGWRVRLKGVDAPELGSPEGERARSVMLEIIGPGDGVACALTGEHTWRREVGFCVTADGIDINREIIVRGAALSCPRYSVRYLADESAGARNRIKRAAYCTRR